MIKNFYKLSILLLAVSLLLLTGCTRQDRKIINNFNSRTYDRQQEKDGIKTGIKELTSKEANAIFNKTHINPTYKYKILQLVIENNSLQNYKLNKSAFNIEIETIHNISKHLKKAPLFTPYFLTLRFLLQLYIFQLLSLLESLWFMCLPHPGKAVLVNYSQELFW